ncbi:hypothetical protein OEZ85_008896 [Tetradesmus obliquus]|uniref:Protein kinase domain-containing protein n=1 Tax=Tetradesmus obliquus TaxID=3088 RepID=A0ABY8TNW2_TETOB|nr:hypothetical protein OEZ85_008896 [Tetradesmus obliquus]
MAILACLWTLLLSVSTVTGIETVVGSGRELVQALQDSNVERISVNRPIRLENEDFPAQIIKLNRNLTISSPDEGPHQVIDFNAKSVANKLSIGPGYNISLVHLTIKDSRYGPGADVDVLASSPGGILYLHDLAKDQSSCPPLNKPQILAYLRDPTVPGNNVITFPGPIAWDGVGYNYSIHYVDFSTRMSVGENAADRGYVVHKRNSWKLCERVVDPGCVAQADTATCVKQEQDAMDAARFPQQQQHRLPFHPLAMAGIAVASFVAFACLVAAVVACVQVCCKRPKHADAAAAGAILPVHAKPDKVRRSSGSSSSGSSSGGAHGSYNKPDASKQVIGMRPASQDSAASSVPSSWKGMSLLSVGSRCSLSLPSILKGTLTAQQAAELQLGSLIGAGSFGRVFLGCVEGREVAIKVVHHDSRSAPQVASEVELMMKFDHPNLIKAYHYVTWGSAGVSVRLTREHTPDDSAFSSRALTSVISSSSGGHTHSSGPASNAASGPQHMLETWIICELANAGNLQDAVLHHNEGAFFYQNMPHMGMVLQVLLGVARGMQWLHAHNVLHGDLKAANVMLSIVPSSSSSSSGQQGDDRKPPADGDAAGAQELLPKVADFGLSRMMCEGATHLSTHTVGTITHQPPELMRSGRLSKPADVYSFGVMMWEVVMAAHPWKGMMMGEIMSQVMVEGQRLQFGPMVPKAYAAIAQQCWQEDPAARPTFEQLVLLLQQLQQQEHALQDEVAAVYEGVVAGW